jgi:WD40 repeat protein
MVSRTQIINLGHRGLNYFTAESDFHYFATGARNGQIVVHPQDQRNQRVHVGDHAGAVEGMAFSASGKTLFTGSEDSTVKAWDLERLDYSPGKKSNERMVIASLISQDGLFSVTSSNDSKIRIRSPQSGSVLHTLDNHQKVPEAIKLSTDQRFLVSGDQEGRLNLWNLETMETTSYLVSDGGAIHSVDFVSGSEPIVFGSADRFVRVWSPNNGKVKELAGHADRVYAVSSLACGVVVSCGKDGSICAWDPENDWRRIIRIQKGHDGEIRFAIPLLDNRVLTGTRDGQLRVWQVVLTNPPALEPSPPIYLPRKHILGLSVANDGRTTVVASDSNNDLVLLDLHNPTAIISSFTGDSKMLCCAISGNAKFVVAGDRRGRFLGFSMTPTI